MPPKAGVRIFKRTMITLSPGRETHQPILLFILLIAAIGNFVWTPLGGDQQVNVAFAQQADMIGTFPGNIIDAWTVRGPGYKLLIYLFYVGARFLVGYEAKPIFELIFKSEFALFYVLISFLAAWFPRHRLTADGFDPYSAGTFTSLTFLSLSHWVAIQAEDVAALIAILAIGIGISERRFSATTSGVLLAITVTMKGITGVLAPLGLLIIVLYDGTFRRKHAMILGAGVVTGLLLALGFVLLAPRAIIDLMNATIYQSTFDKSFVSRILLSINIYRYLHLPFVLPAGLLGIIILSREFIHKQYVNVGSLILLAAIPLLSVVIQGKGFAYHYSLLIPTAVGLVIWYSNDRIGNLPYEVGSVVFVICIALAILTTTPLSIYADSSPLVYERISNEKADLYQGLENEHGISESDTILYLSGGAATYHMEAGSWLRQFYPLALQRPSARETAIFNSTYRKALAFDGEYILIEEHFFNVKSLPKLERKIHQEYCLIDVETAGKYKVELYQRCE